MLRPTPRTGPDGTIAWRLEWRRGGRAGPKQSVTFSERDYPGGTAVRHARRAAQLVDAHARDITREDVYRTVLGITAEPEAVGPTLDSWFQTWAARKLGVEEGTLSTYRRQWANRVSPALGDVPVDGLTRDDVHTWVAELAAGTTPRGGPLSAQTVHRYHALLHQVLKDAAHAGLVTANVAAGTPLPNPRHGVTDEERVFLTQREAQSLLAAFRSAKARDLVAVLFGTGLRWSEAVALQGRDIDRTVTPATIAVRRAWKSDSARRYLGAPKSQRSRRVVTVDADVLAALDRHADSTRTDALIFGSRTGGEWSHTNFVRDHWAPAVRYAQGWAARGLPVPVAPILTKTPTIHSCRHSHAAWLISAGVPIARVSRRLGHDSITTTDAYYGHLVPSADDDVLAALRR